MPNGITEDKYGVGRGKDGTVKYMRGASEAGPRADAVAKPLPDPAIQGVRDRFAAPDMSGRKRTSAPGQKDE